MTKKAVLQELNLGRRVAEDEAAELASYFVETDQWRQIWSGNIDVVYGPKGAGKSAIYSTLLARGSELFDRGVLVETAEVPQGTPVFSDLQTDPPTSEREFVGLWKVYLLTLVAQVIKDYELSTDASRHLVRSVEEAGLTPSKNRRSMVRSARELVRRLLEADSLEPSVRFHPETGTPIGAGLKITLGEPSNEERNAGAVSLDSLLELADHALNEAGYELWILLDRLDVAFADSRELEKNALKALFRVYLDLLQLGRLRLKIFLRTDIWRAITAEGFREASHITRELTIEWNEHSLLNLVIRRFLQNSAVRDLYAADQATVLGDAQQQRTLFYRIFPAQVDLGARKPASLDWMVSRTQDGTGDTAPRELIHLLTSARDVQLQKLDLGQEEPEGEMLFARATLKDALPAVSRTRLEKTIYAEYHELKPFIEALEGAKTDHTPASLAAIWNIPEEQAKERAAELVAIGFFEQRGSRSEPRYWVPFLYRAALSLVQGAAERDEEDE